ncbi:MAG: YgjP-like metallopeptidase domain-containing protein [Cetobacterium somerae]
MIENLIHSIEYIILHELARLKYLNHSTKFYRKCRKATTSVV